MNNIGKIIKENRKNQGLTQKEYAKKAGLGLRFIRELEQGKETLKMDKVNKALSFFNLSLAVEHLKQKKLIIFDLDGTLIDSIKDLHNSANYALKLNNFPLMTLEHTRLSIGNGVAMLVKRSLPTTIDEATYHKVLNDFEIHYRNHNLDLTKPFEGMIETLKALKEKGYLLAVSTNKIEDAAKVIVNKFYPNIFDIVVGDNGKRKKKPAPDSIKYIMKKLDISLNDIIYYVGDSEVDYQTAINSKIKPIIATYGYRKLDELEEKIKANFDFINYSKELIEKISLLNNQ